MKLRDYLRDSKDPLNSLVMVTPLFVAYQIGILFTGGIRNGVDFVTDVLLLMLKSSLEFTTGKSSQASVLTAYLVVNAFVLVAALVAIGILRKKGALHPRLWPIVVGESTVYAFLFGSAVSLMMRAFGLDALLAAGAETEMSPFVGLVSSIGAGLYEEIVFRLFLMGGLFAVFSRVLGERVGVAAFAAVVVSSLIFSAVHHIGSMGDPFTLGVFFYRFFAGVILAALFTLRGFAVAVYTHAIYDVLVLVVRGML
jgi:membrane protease YdiL (CAAX protease family)